MDRVLSMAQVFAGCEGVTIDLIYKQEVEQKEDAPKI